MPKSQPERFIGLDVHKHYLVAAAVNRQLEVVWAPQRVLLDSLEGWIRKALTPQDAVVLEMTTNAFQLHDDLAPVVQSVTLVHPPHVALITRAQVMTDRIAALTLAKLHAAGLLPPVWVPPPEVRDLRALLAQRAKLVRLSTQAKNRLHALIHRHHLCPPPGDLFAPGARQAWLELPVSPLERAGLTTDWETLRFAEAQVHDLEQVLCTIAAQDERVPLLVQLPGVALLTALTLLAAIGEITRFPTASQLVGYAGLGARVHDSGQTCHTGRITKTGRRDIRAAMVEAAHAASRTNPHWRQVFARLEPRLGHSKAIVAIARKLLVTVWHVLTHTCADRFADSEQVTRKLVKYAELLGRTRRPQRQTMTEYVRQHLDQLGLGAHLTVIRRGSKIIRLPASQLAAADP